MLTKEMVYVTCFLIKDQFILKMGDGDRYQTPTNKSRRKSDSP